VSWERSEPLATNQLPLTGERTIPDHAGENYWFRRHRACYQWAAARLAGVPILGPVLDAGVGEGYGAEDLALASNWPAVGVELDELTARHARAKYPRVAVVQSNLIALPFVDDAFAVAVSLQVVEHIWDPITYLKELARCTRGPIILSTPNRPVHSPGLPAGGRPVNPFHVREFDTGELTDLLAACNPVRPVEMYGLQHGSRIRAWERAHGSLPESLLVAGMSNAHPSVLDFATNVTEADFTFTKLPTQLPTHNSASANNTDIHDLVAVW